MQTLQTPTAKARAAKRRAQVTAHRLERVAHIILVIAFIAAMLAAGSIDTALL